MAKNDNLGDFLTDIANAIRTKKESSGIINAQDFSSEILSIPSGGGGDFPTISYEEIEYFGWSYYMFSRSNVIEQIPQAWQDMKDSEIVLFDIPLTLVAPNQEMGGMTIDLYVGTNGQLQELYDACANGTIPLPISDVNSEVYYVNNVTTYYGGDVSGDIGFPIPLYNFGSFDDNDNTSFLVGDLTPLGMGLGLVLAKIVNVSIPNNNIVIQQGFEFDNENGIIISNSVTSIGNFAFGYWRTNNQPLVIPNSVTSIGSSAFREWASNNQPLVIPNSVTSIGNYAFHSWNNVPYIEMKSETPPILESFTAFSGQNNVPIYVPDSAVDDYKGATNWVALASRIFSINEK